jgi:hypothetical protein
MTALVALFDHLFNRRIRGFRLIEILAAGCLAALVLSVYLTKAAAGREASAIAQTDRDIAEEQKRVRVLRAELAHLEQPARLEALASQYLSFGPVAAGHETAPEGLAEIARQRETPR